MYFYTVPIPEPKNPGQFLACVKSNHFGIIRVFWNRPEYQVLFYIQNTQKWLLQFNMNIRKSLATVLDCLERDIQFTDLRVREGYGNYEANDDTRDGFLECEWSDFAMDFMAVDVRITHPLRS